MSETVYIKVYNDFITIAEALDNGQRGRLFLAILQYANGIEPEALSGAEWIAFLTIKTQIDRDRSDYSAKSERNKENGRKGGRPRKADGLIENQKNRTVFLETEKSQDKDKDKDKDKDNNIFDVDARGVTVQKYAAENLTTLGYRAMQEINGFIDDLSEDIVRHGIDNALDAGARNWSYVRAILNRYCDEGVKSVGEARASDERFSKRKKDNDEPPERQQTITDELLYG